MRFLISSAIMFFLAHMVIAAEPPTGQEFVSKEGKFKVLAMGTLKQEKLETESDFGKSTLHMNTFEVGNVFYAANFNDFPSGIKDVELNKIYDSSREGAIANLEGKLDSEKEIKIGDFPAREIRIKVSMGKFLFRARVCLVEQRLYQVVVFGPPEEAVSKDADKFLDSFTLTKP